jgi:hypothetical protein
MIRMILLKDPMGIYFELISNSINEISSGTYNFSFSEEPFTFDYGEVALSINTGFEEYYEIIDGSVSVTKSGSFYTIHFEGSLEDGSSFEGNFSGTLLNFSDIPDPQNNASMSANIDGDSWIATDIWAEKGEEYFYLSGVSSNDEYIDLGLNALAISTGAHLTIDNYGVYSAYYSNDFSDYYANSAIVNITQYTGNTISGNFEFYAEDYYSSNTISITSGKFLNVPIY